MGRTTFKTCGRLRSAITLIEVVIVLTLLGLLITISLPAVQGAREAGRRAQCQNNQRQLGIAILTLEGQQGAFPAAVTIGAQGPLGFDPRLRMHNWIMDLLPFIEMQQVADLYDKEAMFFDPRNREAIASRVPALLCSSSPEREVAPQNRFVPSLLARPAITRQTGLTEAVLNVLDKKYSGTYYGALTDYTLVVMVDDRLARGLNYTLDGVPLKELPTMFPLPDGNELVQGLVPLIIGTGEIAFAKCTRAAEVTDGLSNTVMVVECTGRPERWQAGTRTGVREPLPSAWADPLTLISLREVQTPSGRQLINADNDANIYSFHVGGANFLYADGHVRFIVAEVNRRVLVASMTPNQQDN